MNDKVSVLMCVYNTPKSYFDEAVKSILDQTYRNIEFIIVDDASDDEDVLRYLERIERSYETIKLTRNEKNLGLTRSLNAGLGLCSGKYIARMDSDDIAMPDRIQKQVDYMESDPDIALTGGEIHIFGEGMAADHANAIYDRCDDPEIYRIRSLIENSGPAHPTFMFRSAFLHDNGIKYREDILKAQDYGIMVDILKSGGKICKIREPLLKYRVHSGQITRQYETEQMAYQARVSYDYIRNVFPNLTDAECAAMSVLGSIVKWRELVDTIRSKDALKDTCGYILYNHDALETPDTYVSAIKKIIAYSWEKQLYDEKKLEQEFRYEWWKRAFRMSKEKKRVWGMCPYTILSHRFVKMVKKQIQNV